LAISVETTPLYAKVCSAVLKTNVVHRQLSGLLVIMGHQVLFIPP